MKQILSLVGIIILTLSSCQKEDINTDDNFDLSNSINGFEYEISIIEKNTNQSSIKNAIFVLDSDDLIPLILEEYDESGITKPLTLIGVKSKESGKRVRDYTPTEIDSEESGRADEYFRFIEQDVISELESRAYMDSTSNKSLLGHSIGGLATCYAFITYNSLFDNYIALSSSLFWDNFVFFQLEDEAREDISQTNSIVFVGIGENEDFGITNGYVQFTENIENYYPNVHLNSSKVSGSHYGSRSELINKSLNIILK